MHSQSIDPYLVHLKRIQIVAVARIAIISDEIIRLLRLLNKMQPSALRGRQQLAIHIGRVGRRRKHVDNRARIVRYDVSQILPVA